MADRRYALLGHTHAGLGASTAWGSITGTLADQTDLQAALDLKAPLASPTFTGTVDVSAATLTGLSSDDLADVASIAMLDENETVTGTWTFNEEIQLLPQTAPTHAEGLLWYDSTEKSLSYYNDEADVTINVGQENVIRVRNTTGSTITNGSAVYISGATGANLPNISLAQANALATAECIGLVTHDIENNSNGYVTTLGIVRDLDTSAWSAGAELFLSPSVAGGLTSTKPTSDFCVPVGYVVVSNVSVGEIKVTMHPEANRGDLTSKSQNETVTGTWNFSGQPTFYSGGTSGNIKIGRDSGQYYEIQVQDGRAVHNYVQDESDTTDHSVYWSINTPGTGLKDFRWQISGVANMVLDKDGNLDVGGAITAASYGGITEANLVDKTAAETVSGLWSITNTSGFIVSSTTPQFHLRDTNATADEKNWIVRGDAQRFRIQTASDAAPFTGVTDLLNALRSGTGLGAVTAGGAWTWSGAGVFSTSLNAVPLARSVTATGNTATTDYGIVIRFTAGSSQTFTLDGDPPTNAVVLLDNSAGAAWTIAASTSLIWAKDASTGNRTLADDGVAVAIHRGSGTWIINGSALLT